MAEQSWVERYRPKTLSEVIGHPTAVARIKEVVSAWGKKSKPLLLWGESGTGKTSAVHALAKDLSLDLLEINASDTRKAAAMISIVGGALSQGSLFGRGKLILIDELDGLSGSSDRGAIPALVKIIKGSHFPVVCTLNSPYDKKFSALRKVCELIEFKIIPYTSIAAHLKKILQAEKVTFVDSSVNKISRSVGGDVRAAINDAQTYSLSKTLDVSFLEQSEREQIDSMQTALMRVFKTTDAAVAKGAFDHVDEDINKIMLWVDHNLPVEYTLPKDLQKGFTRLSEADIFLSRIRRWQYYRFYVYAYDLLSAGIATAKSERYKSFVTYKPTTRILKLWMAKQRHAKKRVIAEKISAKTHCSVRRALDDLPYLQQLMRHDKAQGSVIAHYYDLGVDEVAWLTK